MVIKFYKTTTPSNVLDKQVTGETTINGNLVGECSVLSPTITIGFTTERLQAHFNYAWIEDFGRWYYVSPPVVNGKTLVYNMNVDVGKTYLNEIKNSTGRILRSDKGSKYLADNLVVPTSERKVEIKKIGTGFTASDTYVLELGGGA